MPLVCIPDNFYSYGNACPLGLFHDQLERERAISLV